MICKYCSCTNLTSIEIPKNLKKISSGMLFYCTSLSSVLIPNGITEIGDQAFVCCYNLHSVSLPESITRIGNSAFHCCPISSITIPADVTTIDEGAFEDCKSLKSVIMKNSVPVPVEHSTFNYRSNATLYVPVGSKNAYETANVWKGFKEIVEINIKDEDNYIMPTASIACNGGQATLPISMNNVEQIVGFQFDLQLPEGVTLATNGNGTMAATLTDRASDQTESHSVDGPATLTVRKAEPGDVNGDGKLSVSDVASIIGYVLNDRPAIFIESAADLNGSKNISVTDGVIVIDKILNANTSAGARRTEEPENEPQ